MTAEQPAPRTEAGLDLYHEMRAGTVILNDAIRSRIIAIEQEVRDDVLTELVGRLNRSGVVVDEHFPDVLRMIAKMRDE